MCYASDRYQNPNEELYDWTIAVTAYDDIFIDPNSLGRIPGSYMHVSLVGVQTSNQYTLNSATGDRRGMKID